MPYFPPGWLSNQDKQQGVGFSAVTPSATIYNFPSNQPLTPPMPGFDDLGAGYNMGFLFSANSAGLIATGVRWYAPVAMTVTPFLNDGGGTNRAVGVATAVSAGWNYIPFTTPYTMTSGSEYVVGITQSTQKYTYLANALATSFTVGPLSVVGPNAGLLSSGSTVAALSAASGHTNAWFGIDVVVST